jgi:hypothetical protein
VVDNDKSFFLEGGRGSDFLLYCLAI